jgi:hypothetical protein
MLGLFEAAQHSSRVDIRVDRDRGSRVRTARPGAITNLSPVAGFDARDAVGLAAAAEQQHRQQRKPWHASVTAQHHVPLAQLRRAPSTPGCVVSHVIAQ